MNNVTDLINELNGRDFDYYLDKLMDNVSDDVDKREGSIIYDAIAPAAMAMAEITLENVNYIKQSHISTASGEFLDYFAADKGTAREPATYAKVTASIVDDNKNIVTNIEAGDSFASLGSEPIFYNVVEKNKDGSYLLRAAEPGTYANQYTGQILANTENDSVDWAEIKEVSVPAKDSESDDSLRARLLSPNNYIAYGGNMADYRKIIAGIDDVGAAQVYHGRDGGGIVKLFILDNDFNAASKALLNEVKKIIDPADNSGNGFGLAPIGHKVTVLAPEVLSIDISTKVITDGKVSSSVVADNIKNNLATYFETLRKQWSKQTNNNYDMTIYRAQVLAIILQTDHVVNAELPKLNNADNDIDLVFNDDVSQLPVIKDVIIND